MANRKYIGEDAYFSILIKKKKTGDIGNCEKYFFLSRLTSIKNKKKKLISWKAFTYNDNFLYIE